MTETPDNQAPAEASADAGQAAETGQGSNPFADFAGEDLGYIQNKGWDKEGGINKLVDSYKNLESMRGVPEDRILKLPEGEDGWDDVYKKLGKPDDATGYSFEAPEGAKIDDGRMEWFNKTALDLNLSKTQHNKMVAASMEYENGIVSAQEEKAEQERVSELNKLKDDWGNAYDERITLGERAVKAFGIDTETINQLEGVLDKEGKSGNAAVIKLFAKLGESISEDKLPAADGQRQFGQTKEMIEADIKTLKAEVAADPTRLANFNKNKGADVEKLARLRKVLNG